MRPALECGVAVAAGIIHDLAVFEYSPRKIKMAITGKGKDSKEQEAKMLQQLLFGSEDDWMFRQKQPGNIFGKMGPKTANSL